MASKTVYSRESRILGRVLQDTRQRSGTLQSEVAERIGTDQTVISNIERGHRRIDVVEFCRFAQAIDADPITLLRDVKEAWSKKD